MPDLTEQIKRARARKAQLAPGSNERTARMGELQQQQAAGRLADTEEAAYRQLGPLDDMGADAPPKPNRFAAGSGRYQAAPWARDLMNYVGETASNIPESAERVATGLYEAVTNPGETLDAAGRLMVGTGQTINEAVGLPSWLTIPGSDLGFGDQRATADAAGQALVDRYGGWEQLGTTFRDDPVGFGLDLTGAAGLPAAAARAPGAIARIPRPGPGPRPPIMSPEDVRVATDAGNAVRETVGNVRGAMTDAARRERGTRAFIENAPTTEALGRQADVFFEAARKSGVRFSSREFGPFRKKLVRRLRDEGADRVLHPKIARLVGLIEDAPPGVAPDMGNLMILRRQFGAAASDMDKSTSRLGSIGVDLIDDFVESGSSSTSGVMRDANRLWSRMKKSDLIDRAIAKADTAQQGLEAGLRAEFKSIYRGIVDGNRKYRGFTPDEVKAIKAVAQGNITGNVLRRIASLGGGSGPQRAMQNLIQGGGVGAGIGYTLAGPPGAAVGALIGPGAGQLAGRMATRGTQRRANLARAMAARGQTPRQARKAPQDSTLTELMAGFLETSP